MSDTPTLRLHRVYEDASGDRWRIILSQSGQKPFQFLAQRVDDKRVRNWYTIDGRWSANQTTSVDLVRECVGVK